MRPDPPPSARVRRRCAVSVSAPGDSPGVTGRRRRQRLRRCGQLIDEVDHPVDDVPCPETPVATETCPLRDVQGRVAEIGLPGRPDLDRSVGCRLTRSFPMAVHRTPSAAMLTYTVRRHSWKG